MSVANGGKPFSLVAYKSIFSFSNSYWLLDFEYPCRCLAPGSICDVHNRTETESGCLSRISDDRATNDDSNAIDISTSVVHGKVLVSRQKESKSFLAIAYFVSRWSTQ